MKNLQIAILVACLFYNCLASTTLPPDNTSPPTGTLPLACSTALGMEKGGVTGIRDDQISASSQLSLQARPSLARLNEDRGLSGWCARGNDKNPYLQIDLLMPHTITKLATQGAASNWVKNFSLAFSYDNIDWFNYTVKGVLKYFKGPRNLHRTAWNNLTQPPTARAVRFHPVYDTTMPTCLRVELYGCLSATRASILSPTTTLPRATRPPLQAPPSIYYVDPPTETGTEENVTLTCHASGLPQPTFTWLTPDGHAVNATAPVYESKVLDDGSENRRGKIVQDDGSLLIFNTRDVDQGVYKCVAINVVGQDNKTVNLTVNKDLVGVDVAITIEDEVFDKDLENKSSVRYKKLEEQVEQELTELFKDIEGFEKVVILGFFNGSVEVHFRVVSNVGELEDKDPMAIANKVGKTVKNSVETGQIGNLKVKQTFELREPPPPPLNVQPADVKQTEAVVTWSHPEFSDMYAISGYSLQVRKIGIKTWTQLTTTRGVNHRLTNLHPDTVYFVRLKSENKYGKGKPSDTGELRTEKGKHELMLVLVIIVVLLLVIMGIAAVFVYKRWKKKRSKNEYNTVDEEVSLNPVTVQPTETVQVVMVG